LLVQRQCGQHDAFGTSIFLNKCNKLLHKCHLVWQSSQIRISSNC